MVSRREGRPVLLTSHYMADVTALAKRAIVIDHGELVYDGALSALTERLAPNKVLKLRFSEAVSAALLAPYGEPRVVAGLEAELLVPRKAVSRRVGKLLERFPVVDIAVEDVPIEEVVGGLFRALEHATAWRRRVST